MKSKLKEIRKERGLTSTYVAKKLGITRQSLCNKENGKSPVGVLECEKLAQLYSMTFEEMEKLVRC